LKATIKKILKALPIAFTKNQRYDRLTKQVIRRVCKPESNCIDVGCHKGEILDLFLQNAPNGIHYGFEPIPNLYEGLKARYTQPNCRILDLALSNQKGTASFNYVVSNPSYSGLLKRKYDRPNEEDTQITVQTDRLDTVLSPDFQVDMMKIDVEGGEWLVLQGATETLTRWKPVVIFEHGLGASEMYGATPEQLFDLFASCGMEINLLDRFLKRSPAFSRAEFSEQFYKQLNYYFVAYPA
jgi:FkbM family methyltransferase